MNKSTKYNNTLKGWSAKAIASAKFRAIRKGLAFDIDIDWYRSILTKNRCQVTGINFDSEFWLAGKSTPFSPTIDRKVPDDGYTKDNCQVVCWIYNTAKFSFSHEDVLRMAKALNEETILLPQEIIDVSEIPLSGSTVSIPKEVVDFIKIHL